MDTYKDRQTDIRTDIWMDRWMNDWTYGRTIIRTPRLYSLPKIAKNQSRHLYGPSVLIDFSPIFQNIEA